MPTGNEMMSILHTVNVFYKAELALSSFLTMLLWTSFSEIFLWIGLFITFCARAMNMGIMWLQIVHMPRGVIGLILAFKFPKSHEILEAVPLDKRAYSFDALKEQLKFSTTVQIVQNGEDNRKFMLMYSGATLICFLTDLLLFAVQYRWYSENTSDFSNLWMMMVTMAYFFFDLMYLVWIFSF